MKRASARALLSILLVAVMLIGCFPAVAAVENRANAGADFSYRIESDGSVTLTAYRGMAEQPVIPAEINGRPVVEIGDGCFQGNVCLRKIRIPEGIRRIGDYAFECCPRLEKIYLPDSLRTVGEGAFSGCCALYLVDFQDGVESIGRGAFLLCSSLVQLELPAALQELGDFAFAECCNLSSVRFHGNLLSRIPDRAFYACTSLTRLDLPDSITAVGKRAFADCGKLDDVHLSAPLAALGDFAFAGCSSLTYMDLNTEVLPQSLFLSCFNLSWFNISDATRRIEAYAFQDSGISNLSIPASVEEIVPGAFYHLSGSVSVEDNPYYTLIDGSLYTADGKTLLAYFPAPIDYEDPEASEEPQTSFTVPEGVEVLASCSLAASGLESITLPSTLKRIDAYAFAETSIENLEIPAGVEVDPDAFCVPGQHAEPEPDEPDDPTEPTVPDVIGSVAGDRNLFREEDFVGFREIGNDEFDAWCDTYLDWNQINGIPFTEDQIPYIMRYKTETFPYYVAMTAVQNHDPGMWAEAASAFGDDFEQMYLMMDHGLFTELRRGRMEDDLILYSGLYDSQLMAAAGTDVLPTQEQLVDAIGTTFSDPIMISTTTDPGIACSFGDTLFVIYASHEAMDALGAVCIDALCNSTEKEILMNANAQYRILDVGNMAVEHQEPWDPEPTTLYRQYVKVELLPPETRFEDVPRDAYYFDAVQWAVENGITTGTGETTFSPNQTANRAQIATFLWRAYGCEEPSLTENPFTDVRDTAYYAKPVLWAAEHGITSGATATTFLPNESCTRAQAVTFLWRANGCPEPAETENPFKDVRVRDYYYKAVLWALENGVTAGVSETSFAPNEAVTRAQVVTVLYRTMSA